MRRRDEPRGDVQVGGTAARDILNELAHVGASVRLGGGGQLLLQNASRVPAELRARVRAQRDTLVEALVAQERWARTTTDRERS